MSDSYWLIGPLGMGLNMWVEKFPEEDQGCFSQSFFQSLVWDSSIVAKLISDEKITIRLLGNNLGTSPIGNALRKELNSFSNLYEVGESPASPPIDLLINTLSGTRTWVSNITPPKISDMLTQIKKFEAEIPELVYCDFWQSTLENSFELLPYIKARIFFLNIGDCDSLDFIKELLAVFDEHNNLIVQVSYKNTISLESINALNLKKNITLIITRGSEDLLVAQKENIQVLPVKKINNVLTTGAGAILSASIIKLLLHENNDLITILDVITRSIEETNLALSKSERRYFLTS